VYNRHSGRLAIHGEARDKASLYRDRYQVLLQSLSRDKYFSKPAFDMVTAEDSSCEVFYFLYFLYHKLIPVISTTYTQNWYVLQEIYSIIYFSIFCMMLFAPFFFHADNFYTIINWVHRKEMDYGSHIAAGGAPVLLGGSYWSSAD
jgi:hypothetical protein